MMYAKERGCIIEVMTVRNVFYDDLNGQRSSLTNKGGHMNRSPLTEVGSKLSRNYIIACDLRLNYHVKIAMCNYAHT